MQFVLYSSNKPNICTESVRMFSAGEGTIFTICVFADRTRLLFTSSENIRRVSKSKINTFQPFSLYLFELHPPHFSIEFQTTSSPGALFLVLNTASPNKRQLLVCVPSTQTLVKMWSTHGMTVPRESIAI